MFTIPLLGNLQKVMGAQYVHKKKGLDYIPTNGSELVIFDPDSGDTHFLNETAAEVLSLIDQFSQVESMVQALIKEYDEDPAVIEDDIRQTLTELLEKGILVEET